MQHRILIEINAQVGKTMLIFRPALKNECRSEENYSWSAKPAITSNGEHWYIYIINKRWNVCGDSLPFKKTTYCPVISSLMTYHRVCNKSNMTSATRGTGTATLPEHLSSPTVFSGVRVTRSLVLCVMFCRSLFVLFLLVIVLYVLRFTDSHYLVGICKLLSQEWKTS
jgi:hypothetical protein